MRAITFLFVDQSSSGRLEKVGEDTPTSREIIEAYMLNFRPKFNFFAITLVLVGPPSQWGVR